MDIECRAPRSEYLLEMAESILVVAIAIVAIAIIVGLGWVQNARNRANTRKGLARIDEYNAEELPEQLNVKAIPAELTHAVDPEELSHDVDEMRSAKGD